MTQGFVVTFDTQGGTAIARQEVERQQTATRPTTNPTREHYTFDNWYTTAETAGQIVTFDTRLCCNL